MEAAAAGVEDFYRFASLTHEHKALLQAHCARTVPLDLVKEEMDRLPRFALTGALPGDPGGSGHAPLAPTLTLLLALATGGCTGGEPSVGAGPPAAPRAESSAPTAEPDVRVEVVANGLEHVWDIGFLPDGTALVTERPGRIRLLSGTGPGAAVSEVATDLGDVYARGEGGLMGLLVHPDFAQTAASRPVRPTRRAGLRATSSS